MRIHLLTSSLVCILSAAASAQTTHMVAVDGITFTPANLSIQVGDTVQWNWVTGFHNVESGVGGVHDGIFRSGDPVNPPATYSVTFDAAFLSANPQPGGAYPYYCVVHEAFGQTGTITVLGAPVPALPLWGLFATLGGVAGGACLLLRRKKKGLPQA